MFQRRPVREQRKSSRPLLSSRRTALQAGSFAPSSRRGVSADRIDKRCLLISQPHPNPSQKHIQRLRLVPDDCLIRTPGYALVRPVCLTTQGGQRVRSTTVTDRAQTEHVAGHLRCRRDAEGLSGSTHGAFQSSVPVSSFPPPRDAPKASLGRTACRPALEWCRGQPGEG